MYPSIMMNLKTKKALHHIRAVLICLFLVIICLTLNPNPGRRAPADKTTGKTTGEKESSTGFMAGRSGFPSGKRQDPVGSLLNRWRSKKMA